MVGLLSSAQWAVTALLVATAAACLLLVDGRRLDGVDGIQMVMTVDESSELYHSPPVALEDRHPFCQFCRTAIGDFQAAMNRPDAVDAAVNTFETFVCHSLHGKEIVERCTTVAEIYIPALIDVLRKDMTEENVCESLELCDDVEPSRTPTRAAAAAADYFFAKHHPKRKCALCEAFVAQTLRYLEANATVEELIELAHKGCKKLKGDVAQAECDSLVDVYGESFPSLLASLTPEEVCSFVKLCSEDGNEGGEGVVENDDTNASLEHGGGNECVFCRIAIINVKKRLEKPRVQAKIMSLLDRTCEKVPKHEEQCKAFLEAYGENFFANLDVILEPVSFCRSVGACHDPDFVVSFVSDGAADDVAIP